MSDDWDLYAVVRSCTNAATPYISQHMVVKDDDEDNNTSPNSCSNVNTPMLSCAPDDQNAVAANQPQVQGLEESYCQSYVEKLYQPQVVFQPQLNNSLLIDPPTGSSIFANSLTSNTTRSRRRKSQQMKMVHQMTQEELSGDSWAWRKYGQKPIKGSPYPRNYYRCSTLKGCAARRQVERSPIDGAIFIVSYTGEHTHPRPTHRSSLAGSTRTKLSTAVSKPTSCSSSSVASASSFSPPLTEGDSQHDINNTKIFNDNADDDEGNEDDDEEEGTLIPDNVMNEEMFKGFGFVD